MKKIIILSFIIMCVSIVLGKVLNDWVLTIKISGSVCLVCFGLAAILNDTFVSKDRLRANNSTNKEDKIVRNKITNVAMVVGSSNIMLAAIIFFIINIS